MLITPTKSQARPKTPTPTPKKRPRPSDPADTITSQGSAPNLDEELIITIETENGNGNASTPSKKTKRIEKKPTPKKTPNGNVDGTEGWTGQKRLKLFEAFQECAGVDWNIVADKVSILSGASDYQNMLLE